MEKKPVFYKKYKSVSFIVHKEGHTLNISFVRIPEIMFPFYCTTNSRDTSSSIAFLSLNIIGKSLHTQVRFPMSIAVKGAHPALFNALNAKFSQYLFARLTCDTLFSIL